MIRQIVLAGAASARFVCARASSARLSTAVHTPALSSPSRALFNISQRYYATERDLVLPGDEGKTPKASMPMGLKRFYKNVHVQTGEDGRHSILLDSRVLKTPAKNLLSVVNRDLAVAIAAEWEARASNEKMDELHLTMLANTAIDRGTSNKADRIASLLNYIVTDTLVVREHPETPLGEMQVEQWDPLVRWFEKDVLGGHTLSVSHELLDVQQSEQVLERLRDMLVALDTHVFVGVEEAVQVAKSFIVGMAVVRRQLTPHQGSYLARLETEFQIARWGEVEWGHTIDSHETQTRLAAAALYARLSERDDAHPPKK